MKNYLYLNLKEPLQPVDRGGIYEDPLQEVLDARAPGSAVVGGGTAQGPDGSPTDSDIEVEVVGDPAEVMALVIDVLEFYGAPKGCTARLNDGEPVSFGRAEGLELALNGYDLPAEVYQANDVNELLARIGQALGTEGRMHSHWVGPKYTSIYFYGPSADRLRELVEPITSVHPLAAQSVLTNRNTN